jgi:DNA repair protein RecO (recombination protein O)
MRGKLSAIAKGVRRSKSRFGGRLEPFFRLNLELHEGRSDLMTVTGAETISAYTTLRADERALNGAARACDSLGRVFDSGEAHPEVFNLLCSALTLLDDHPENATDAFQIAFRMKLLLAAGFAPQLAACATCGEAGELVGFSPAAGGVVCASCEAGSFELDGETHRFLTDALGRPLADLPSVDPRVVALADRAVSETAAHHGQVRFKAIA